MVHLQIGLIWFGMVGIVSTNEFFLAILFSNAGNKSGKHQLVAEV